MRLAALLPLVFLFGCAGSFSEARIAGAPAGIKLAPLSPACEQIDSAHRTWSSVEKTAAFLAGGSGIGMIPYGEDKNVRIGLAVGSVTAASVAVFASVESDSFAADWAKECQ